MVILTACSVKISLAANVFGNRSRENKFMVDKDYRSVKGFTRLNTERNFGYSTFDRNEYQTPNYRNPKSLFF